MEASKRADFVRKIHVTTKEAIEKKGKYTADRVNKKRKEVLFQPGDLVWVHFRKDRFPQLRKSKLLPRGAGPYKVLAKINDNAYKIDLPIAEYGVSNSFNVADLTPYEGEDIARGAENYVELLVPTCVFHPSGVGVLRRRLRRSASYPLYCVMREGACYSSIVVLRREARCSSSSCSLD
jgi:hypothetical protein